MRDFVQACKILKSGKTRKVVDLAKKWNSNFNPISGSQSPTDASSDQWISFSEETRQFNQEVVGGSYYFKNQWYKKNSQYLESAVMSGMQNFREYIERLIEQRDSDDPMYAQEIDEFNNKFFRRQRENG